MLKIIDSNMPVSTDEAYKLYPKCNYLMIDTFFSKGRIIGKVYAVSEEPETLLDLNRLDREKQIQGHKTLIGGDYYPDCLFDYLEIEEM